MSGDRRELRYPDKTVYILGAGFSATAGLPLLRDFFPHALRILKEPTGHEREDNDDWTLAGRLVRMMARCAPMAAAVNIDLDNLEDLFCLVDYPATRRDRHDDDEADGGGVSTHDEKELLNRVIIRTFTKAQSKHDTSDHSPTNPVPCKALAQRNISRRLPVGITARCRTRGNEEGVCLYDAFVSQVLSDQTGRVAFSELREENRFELDAIISLNYDLVLESAAAAFENVYLYYGKDVVENCDGDMSDAAWDKWEDEVRDGRQIVTSLDTPAMGKRNGVVLPIVKLHGSINWCGIRPGSGRETRPQSVYQYEHVRSMGCAPGGPPTDVPLVAPTWGKQLPKTSIFGKLGNEAIEHVQRASKIVIIGYSLPFTDQHFRYLLARGLTTPEFPDIEVWDIVEKAEIEHRLERVFGPKYLKRIHCHDSGLQGFVQSRVERRTDY